MAGPDNTSSAQEWFAASDEILQSAIDRLTDRSKQRETDGAGLTSEFTRMVGNPEIIQALCERAMESLAENYVQHLEQFQILQDPIQSLNHLENAEVIWRSETALISQFDTVGTEKAFLSQMREQALMVLENKLEDVSSTHETSTTPERMALVIGILAVMDQMAHERGEDKHSATRTRYREIVHAFH